MLNDKVELARKQINQAARNVMKTEKPVQDFTTSSALRWLESLLYGISRTLFTLQYAGEEAVIGSPEWLRKRADGLEEDAGYVAERLRERAQELESKRSEEVAA